MNAHDRRHEREADEPRAPFPPLYASELLPTPDACFPALLPDVRNSSGHPVSAQQPSAIARPINLGLDVPGRPGH